MKFIALVSGGIDSPVAAYMIGRLGHKIIPVYFNNSPYSDESNTSKVVECVERLKKNIDIDDLIVVQHGKNLVEISQKCERKYTCVLCKRMMFRIAEKLCYGSKCDGIITGEFLASKASQTLRNMTVISQSVNIPIIRPLLGLDKEEILKIAKEIGTFIQNEPPVGCCSIVPYKPSTKAKLEKIIEEEKKINVGKMVEK